MAHAKRLAAILPLLAVLFFSSSALAQIVTITQTTRDDIDPGRDPLSINRSDCVENGVINVTVTVANQEDYQLEVWGGTGTCDDDETRNQLNSTQCWEIFSDEARNMTIPMRVQDVVQPPTDEGGETRCDQGSGDFTVWFLLVSGTVNKTANAPTLTFSYDLSGPSPPELNSVRSGENSLVLRWDGSNSNDVNGYRIYCQEADDSEPSGTAGGSGTAGSSGTAGLGGTGGTTSDNGGTSGAGEGTAGAAASGGTGGASSGGVAGGESTAGTAGTTSDNGCRGAVLRAGQVPSEQYRVGSASQGSEEGTAKGLVNNRSYACGVAAYDDDDNVGLLSNMLCERPRPVVDYYEAYRRAGGTAGGGYCSFGRASTGHVLSAFAGLGILALALRRRSRRSVP